MSFVTTKDLKDQSHTFHLWSIHKDKVQEKIASHCVTTGHTYVKHDTMSLPEYNTYLDSIHKKDKKSTSKKKKPSKKKSYTPKWSKKKEKEPEEPKKKEPETETQLEDRLLGRNETSKLPTKLKYKIPIAKVPKKKFVKKSLPEPKNPISHPKRKNQISQKVCVKDGNTGAISRVERKEGNKQAKKDSERFSIVPKEEWKAWKKKKLKGDYKTGIVQLSDARINRDTITKSGVLLRNKLGADFAMPKFERSLKKMTAFGEQQNKQSKSVYGAMPIYKHQKITIKVPEVIKVGRSTEAYHVYAQDLVGFTFKSNNRTIVKGEDGKLHFKNLNPVVVDFRVGKRILLETRELNYDYTKPASTITKTIIHDITYTDSTSSRSKPLGNTGRRNPYKPNRVKHANYRTGETRVPVSQTDRGKRTKANRTLKRKTLS